MKPSPQIKTDPPPADGYWALAVVLAWAVPGLGHWYLGRPGKAAVYALAILGLFFAGLILGHWQAVSYNDTLLFVGQSLTGLPAFIAGYAGKGLPVLRPGQLLPLHAEMATLYTLIAGFLNLLVVIDAFMIANHIPRAHQIAEQEQEELKARLRPSEAEKDKEGRTRV
jgi:hypothetical protein